MPNYCNYSLKAVGEEENLKKLFEVMNADYKYIKNEDGTITESNCKWKHMFRVFQANMCGKIEDNCMKMSGYCAWSVHNCMMYRGSTYYNDAKKEYGEASKGTHLAELSKELDLDIEIFSEEGGCGFMEHILIKKGAVEIYNCVEWAEAENEETGEYETVSGGLEWEFSI